MTKAEVAREYRDRYGMQMPTAKLARIMYENAKLIFDSEENARSVLRYIEGKSGDKDRKRVGDKNYVMKEKRPPANQYSLPESDETSYEPFIIRAKKLAVISDIHVPYHNNRAISAMLDFLKAERPDALLINGDLLDFHGLSRFMKDPRKKNFAEELRIAVDLVKVFQKVLKCKIYFKEGNHDERYQMFLWNKAGEISGLDEFEFSSIINKRLPDVTVIGDKRIVKANELSIVHGHEFGASVFSPVNIARGLFLRAKASALAGHHHRTSEHTEKNINEKITTTWSTGCLCELHPSYLPINSWNHGFALVELNKNRKEYNVHNLRIFNGKIL